MAYGERRQNIARIRQIGEIAGRNGFGFLIDSRRARRRIDESAPAGTRGERLRTMFDELGPTFVKFGQLLSTRPDLLPPDVVSELRHLQDSAAPVASEQVRAMLTAELGRPIDEVFERFDDAPVASASIGQVHRAVHNGRDVAVKVQRPDAEATIAADINLLHQMARLAKQRVRRLRFVDTVAVVDEFARAIRQELDYRVEARNVQVAHAMFADDDSVVVPTVDWTLTTSRVLVLDWIPGPTLNRVDLATWSEADRTMLAGRISDTWMRMVFGEGTFHADPHPANIVVQGPDRIGLIDFGMVGQLSARDRQAAVHLFLDCVEQNLDRLPRRLREIGVRYQKDREDDLREQISIILQRYWGVSLGEIDGRELLRDILHAVYQVGARLPTRWVLLDKALATLGGVALEISPTYNVFETARPYARKLMVDRYRPDVLFDRARTTADRYREVVMELPFQVHDLMDELRDGELKIAIQQEGFTESTERALGASNRFAMAILAASVFLGSALLGGWVEAGPHLLGVAVIAIPGLILGPVLAAIVMVGVLRSGRW